MLMCTFNLNTQNKYGFDDFQTNNWTMFSC